MSAFSAGFGFADEIDDDDENYIIDASLNIEESVKNLEVGSKNVVAIDRKTLNVLYEKDAYTEVAMASTTKIMTAIVVIEKYTQNDEIEVSQEVASVRGSRLGLKKNDKITIDDLLYGLMLRSGNDCAVALAEYISGSVEQFAELMNNKATELGLEHTHFVTPHGLDDENHYTTAYELAILTDYALKNERFSKIVGTKTANIVINGYPRTISNTNELLGNCDGVYGVKTGFTFNAGRCLVSSCKRNNMDIIVVVLGANTKKQRTIDSVKIINYIYKNFDYVDLERYIFEEFEMYKSYFEKNVILYKSTTKPIINLEKSNNYEFPLKIQDIQNLKTKFFVVNELSSQNYSGEKIGSLQCYYNDKILCSFDVILENNIEKNDFWYYMKQALKCYTNFIKNIDIKITNVI